MVRNLFIVGYDAVGYHVYKYFPYPKGHPLFGGGKYERMNGRRIKNEDDARAFLIKVSRDTKNEKTTVKA